MVCEECPFGKLIQVDNFIWMIECSIENTLMACKDECLIPEAIERKDI